MRLFGTIAVLGIVFAFAYLLCGVKQGVGALIGGSLLMAAWRETARKRIILTVAGVAILGMTFLTTLSADYFVKHHAEDIVNAGAIFREGCSPVQRGMEIALHDPRIPAMFHKMGVQRIWIDPERIAIYVGGEREFQIYRDPHPSQTDNPVWGFRGKGATKINDRLWSNDY